MFELTLGLAAAAVLAQLAYRMCEPGVQLVTVEAADRVRRPGRAAPRTGPGAPELARRGAIALVALGILAVGLAQGEVVRATALPAPLVAALR